MKRRLIRNFNSALALGFKPCRLTAAAVTVVVGVSACSSPATRFDGSRPSVPATPETYQTFIDSQSAGKEAYNGFYNTFDFKATMLNSAVRDVMLNQQGDYYNWEPSKLAAEKEKANQEASTETHVFMSFFTPNNDDDNLASKNSIWRIFIDAGGQRYAGTAKKVHENLSALMKKYPYHTRWATPYLITFPVATATIEGSPTVLTVTGPIGLKSVTLPAASK